MGGWDWKNDRRLHFAIGLAALLLGAKLIFTETWTDSVKVLSGATESMETIDADGQLKSSPVSMFFDGWLPVILDSVYSVVVFIGAKCLAGALWGSGLIRSGVESISGAKQSAQDALPASSVPALDVTTDDYKEYIRATKGNDSTKMDEYRIKIRKPDACKELAEACIAGDFVTADPLYAELKALFDVSPLPVKGKRGTNA